jgi:predicted MFS family arabinose efflux permease
LIALLGNLLIGYAASRLKRRAVFLLVMPVVLATAFFMIADIDSPRGGYINVKPQNLRNLSNLLPHP